mmetsp:Transcript_3706/g.13637  ORF Transcript_3706/g.13637 Transcript_3706/m.13637 type:complete len:291 (-) Transcript_3706:1706-2578(-)
MQHDGGVRVGRHVRHQAVVARVVARDRVRERERLVVGVHDDAAADVEGLRRVVVGRREDQAFGSNGEHRRRRVARDGDGHGDVREGLGAQRERDGDGVNFPEQLDVLRAVVEAARLGGRHRADHVARVVQRRQKGRTQVALVRVRVSVARVAREGHVNGDHNAVIEAVIVANGDLDVRRRIPVARRERRGRHVQRRVRRRRRVGVVQQLVGARRGREGRHGRLHGVEPEEQADRLDGALSERGRVRAHAQHAREVVVVDFGVVRERPEVHELVVGARQRDRELRRARRAL